MKEVSFVCCDFENPDHLQALADLLNHYMEDPMGNHPPLSKREQLRLVDGLANHPTAFVLFVSLNDAYAGMVTCFELFSTFQVRPYLYIHDIVVHRSFRGMGLGKLLMSKLVETAKEKNHCKITLEVRSDNVIAQQLYQRMDFKPCKPDMYFWTKPL